jgi:hypothetical protein
MAERVNVENFVRAETDRMFAAFQARAAGVKPGITGERPCRSISRQGFGRIETPSTAWCSPTFQMVRGSRFLETRICHHGFGVGQPTRVIRPSRSRYSSGWWSGWSGDIPERWPNQSYGR